MTEKNIEIPTWQHGTAAKQSLGSLVNELVVQIFGRHELHSTNPRYFYENEEEFEAREQVRKHMNAIEWQSGELYERCSDYADDKKKIDERKALLNSQYLLSLDLSNVFWYIRPSEYELRRRCKTHSLEIVFKFMHYHDARSLGTDSSLQIDGYNFRGNHYFIVNSYLRQEKYIPGDAFGCGISEDDISSRNPRSVFASVYGINLTGITAKSFRFGTEPHEFRRKLILKGRKIEK